MRYILLIQLIFLLSGCEGPQLENGRVVRAEKISIAHLKSLYAGTPIKIQQEIRVEGRVVSQDGYGNFPRTIFIEDATGGIAFLVDHYDRDYLAGYGNWLSISCNQLTIGDYGGMLQVGVEAVDSRYEVGYIPSGEFQTRMQNLGGKSGDAAEIAIDQLTMRHIGCAILLRDVQFAPEEQGLNWCEPDSYTFHYVTTNRHIQDPQGNRLIVRTRASATFAGQMLPLGQGWIRGVLTYFNGDYQLVIPAPYHVEFQ